MKNFEFEIGIIGGGCIGSSILFELASRGFKNLVLIDHGRKTLSATANSGGMLRVFHESPEHIDLALGHHQKLQNLINANAITEALKPNGNLYFFNKNRYQGYKANLQKLNRAKYPFEIFDPEIGQRRFPEFKWKDNEMAIYEPLGSHLNPQSFARDLLDSSMKQGAFLIDDFEVRRISPYQNHFRICAERGHITVKTLILAGGARLIPCIENLGIQISLTSKNLRTYVSRDTRAKVSQPNYFDRESLNFGRFAMGHPVILSNPKDTRLNQSHANTSFEEVSAFDCYAPDRQGFCGQISGHQGLYLASGWGGTGFKFALEVGRRLANAIEANNEKVFQTREITYA